MYTPYNPKENESPIAEFGGIKLFEIGIVVDTTATQADWANAARFSGTMHKSSAWWYGDLMLAGEYHNWMTDWEDATQSNVKSVCKRVPPDRRRADRSFGHHAVVTFLYEQPDEQRAELKFAADNQLSVQDFSRHIREKYRGGGDPAEYVICRGMTAKVEAINPITGTIILTLQGSDLIEFEKIKNEVQVTITAMIE